VKFPYISTVGSLVQHGDKRGIQQHGYCDTHSGGNYGMRQSKINVLSTDHGYISWYSRQQQAVAISSTEAAYVTAGQAGSEALWLRQLLRERHSRQVKLTAIAEAVLRPVSCQNKHHFLRELYDRGETGLDCCKTALTAADVLTKALAAEKHVFGFSHRGLLPAAQPASYRS